MNLTKSKVLAPVSAIVCAIPLVLQQPAISGSERQLATTPPPADSTPAAPSATSAPRLPIRPATGTTGSVSSNRDWMTLFAETFRLNTPADSAAFTAKLESMRLDERLRLIRDVGRRIEITPLRKAEFYKRVVSTMLDSDPARACVEMIEVFQGQPMFSQLFSRSLGYTAFEKWIAEEPANAISRVEEMARDKKAGYWAPERLFQDFQLPLFRQLVLRNPEGARVMLQWEDPEDGQYLVRRALRSFTENGGARLDHEERPANPDPTEVLAYLRFARELPDLPGERPALQELTSHLAMNDRIKDLKIMLVSGNLSASEEKTVSSQLAQRLNRKAHATRGK